MLIALVVGEAFAEEEWNQIMEALECCLDLDQKLNSYYTLFVYSTNVH